MVFFFFCLHAYWILPKIHLICLCIILFSIKKQLAILHISQENSRIKQLSIGRAIFAMVGIFSLVSSLALKKMRILTTQTKLYWHLYNPAGKVYD